MPDDLFLRKVDHPQSRDNYRAAPAPVGPASYGSTA